MAPRLACLLLVLPAALAEDAPNLAIVDPPAAHVSVPVAIETGVAFLASHQNANGSFGTRTSGRPWGVSADVPGGHLAFQAATTALCWMGLHAVAHQPEASLAAQRRALAWLVRNARVKRASPGQLYNTWSFAYGLRALAEALRARAPGATEEELTAAARDLIAAIAIYQTPDGGWGYYDFRVGGYKPEWSTSFQTASMVVALHEARGAGLDVPQPILDKALANIRACRTPEDAYLYGLYSRYYPLGVVNRPQGSSLRTQSCNLALRLFGGLTDEDLLAGFEQLEAQHRFAIAGVRRPIPHESWYAVSGYFYLYGQQYAACLLGELPEAERRLHARSIAHAVLKTRQPDGSFWDYPLYGYHKFYGTGYALMALARCGDVEAP